MQYGNESSVTASRWPLCRSYDVTTDVTPGHGNPYVISSWRNTFGVICEVSLCFVIMQRLICSITYLGHLLCHVFWPDSPSFQIYLLGLTCIYVSLGLDLDAINTMAVSISLRTVYFRSYLQKMLILLKSDIFCLAWPGKVKMCTYRSQIGCFSDLEHPKLSVRPYCKVAL